MIVPGDTLICPICKSKARPLPRTGDAMGYECETHGRFKVADSVLRLPSLGAASGEQWERALKNAKWRARPGEWPVIVRYDFL
jgi:hypothetical protein